MKDFPMDRFKSNTETRICDFVIRGFESSIEYQIIYSYSDLCSKISSFCLPQL